MLLSGLKAFKRTFLNKVTRLSEKHATTDATSTSTPEAPPLPPSTGFIDQISARHVQAGQSPLKAPHYGSMWKPFCPKQGKNWGTAQPISFITDYPALETEAADTGSGST
nr:hypothetical protein [Acetobacter persici]